MSCISHHPGGARAADLTWVLAMSENNPDPPPAGHPAARSRSARPVVVGTKGVRMATPSTPSADEEEFTSTVIEKDKGYSDVAHTDALPWVVARCLMGLGLNGPQITQIMTKGTPEAFWAAGGRAALACLRGK